MSLNSPANNLKCICGELFPPERASLKRFADGEEVIICPGCLDQFRSVVPIRPTESFIRARAQSHVAYNWSPCPGSHDRNIVWTDEDTAIYLRFYNAAYNAAKR